MENCIYHSRDLDGLSSGAIIKFHQNHFNEECLLHPLDYGEKIDIRKFKGKSCIMIDVSLNMERMEQLGQNCLELIWVDHHESAFNDLAKYCTDKKYEIEESRINGLITMYKVNKMNLTYYYSKRLSAAEIALTLYGAPLNKKAKEIVERLGQYDTWRNNVEKKFIKDLDWEKVILPFQYGMRQYKSPEEIVELFEEFSWKTPSAVSEIIDKITNIGSSILNYQKEIFKKTLSKNSFIVEGVSSIKDPEIKYDFVCVNAFGFSSIAFEGFYWPEVHHGMLTFFFNGKKNIWEVSLYTTHEDVDILSIAQSFNGGGHKMACGFQINAEDLQPLNNKEVIFELLSTKQEPKNISKTKKKTNEKK